FCGRCSRGKNLRIGNCSSKQDRFRLRLQRHRRKIQPNSEVSDMETNSSNPPIHLLLVAVVQDQDLENATNALKNIGASLTYLSSAGGFLGRRNATLLIGLPAEREAQALAALHEACRQRVGYMTLPLEGSPMPM